MKDHGACEADANAAGLPAGCARRPAFRKLNLTHDTPRVFIEDAARIRQFNSTRQTAKKLRTDLVLELAYLLTEGRLGHPETLCGPSEIPFLGNDHEVL